MIEVHEALKIILSKIQFKGTEKIPIGQSLGRVLCEDIIAQRPNPPLDNSAMDGYALIAGDIQSATPENPVKLEILEHIQAGYTGNLMVESGKASRIMTGAPIPLGADAVIMQEDTEANGNFVVVKDKAEVGENIRMAGEDVQEGEKVIQKGLTIQPAHIGMMAVVGRSNIYVAQRPSVAILSTGDEIKDLDESPKGPCIYNSNGYMLGAQVRSAGGVPVYLGISPDEEDVLLEKFNQALKCDLVISSGGVSVGDYDLVKASLEQMGQEMLFWKVAMKPGKPLAFGKIGSTPIFGLPGNPVSSFVSFEQFVRPAIGKMFASNDAANQTVAAKLTETIHKKPGRQHFLSSRISWTEGEYLVSPISEQGSGILKSMSNANALLIFPREATELREGEIVTVQLLKQSQ
ncbi:MAG: gephyrin-like molybdotransferase Glp [Nitrospinota bacterium]|nr:gephyrin-like molybdotransferase Glp [Nitrospinota bacterium]